MPMESPAPPVVSNPDRVRLAEVFDRFVADKNTVNGFTGEVYDLLRSADRSVQVIAEAWCDYGELQLWVWWRRFHGVPPEQQVAIERCRQFLHSDLRYEWPDPPNLLLVELALVVTVLLGMVLLGHLLFGLVIVLMGYWFGGAVLSVACIGAGVGVLIGYRALLRWKRERWADAVGVGDIDVWPFMRRADYDRVVKAIAGGESSQRCPSDSV
jgi:hypothetical protein